jgi:hypothetical protein
LPWWTFLTSCLRPWTVHRWLSRAGSSGLCRPELVHKVCNLCFLFIIIANTCI